MTIEIKAELYADLQRIAARRNDLMKGNPMWDAPQTFEEFLDEILTEYVEDFDYQDENWKNKPTYEDDDEDDEE